MDMKQTARRMPLRRILLFAFCGLMAAVMTALLIERTARLGAGAHPEKLAGNIALWLAPVACRLLFKDKVSDLVLWVFCVFAFLASFLGTVMGLYARIWWYDLVMHAASGYLVSYLGLFIACKLADVRTLHPALTMTVCFAVSLAVAGLWEIFEFATDQIFDGVAQGFPITAADGTVFRSVNDTMEDMICGACGATAFAAHYLAHVLSGRSLLLDAFKRDFTGLCYDADPNAADRNAGTNSAGSTNANTNAAAGGNKAAEAPAAGGADGKKRTKKR